MNDSQYTVTYNNVVKYNPAKQTDDVIITTTNILQEIDYQELHHLLDPHRL